MQTRSSFSAWMLFLAIASFGWPAEAETNYFRFKTPNPLVCRLEGIDAARGQSSEWLNVFVGQGTNVLELGDRVVLHLDAGVDFKKVLVGCLSKPSRSVAENVFILQSPNAMTALREAEKLAQMPGVLASYPVMRREAELQGAYAPRPNDEYYAAQWNLEDRRTDGSRSGLDLNIRAAWPHSVGEGVVIAVGDVGIELSHIELSQRAAGQPHFNFATGTTNGLPHSTSAAWAHGTQVAGLAVAEANNGRGMAGVAPKANLASWVAFTTNQILASDEQLMDMYQYQSNLVSVQNHSWTRTGVRQDGPTLLEQIGISNAVHHGRNGRGVIMVRSAGNFRFSGANANDDGYSANPYSISVAAAHRDGRTGSYSEPGACILVAAPSGENGTNLFTTDLLGLTGRNQISYCPPWDPECPTKDLSDYVFNSIGFTGTSAAAPQIAGIAALMLSANTNLHYRDVQQILALSARHSQFSDPHLMTNGAGFRVSPNLGFGVPDAGVAVQLAIHWPGRPSATNFTLIATNTAAIPDGGLQLLISGEDVPSGLDLIQPLPSTGIQADDPTASLPLVDIGFATNVTGINLTNKAALIQRSPDASYAAQITRAAQVGAAFAIVFNNASGDPGCAGGDSLCPMLGTDFVPIPAVFIGLTQGTALKDRLQAGIDTAAQLRRQTTNYTFVVTNGLVTEHVGVRVRTDHPLRGDLRITLVSPQGTRSVLQRFNDDTSAGPVDWTYYSTHHFFESSVGTWTVTFGDEFPGSAGNVQSASLILNGVSIVDSDQDGLDDSWENTHFNSLAFGPKDDPDHDGYSNAREQVMQTHPNVNEVPFKLDLAPLRDNLMRLSWPGSEHFNYELLSGTNVLDLSVLTNVPGKFPETEWIIPLTNTARFFQLRAIQAE